MIEREIKLSYRSAEAARAALAAAGAEPLVPRRLQDDLMYDTPDNRLFAERSALRLRRDEARAVLTYKGPVEPGITKSREEIETDVANHEAMATLLGRLGFAPWFRYQKYREEFRAPGVIAAIDETPAGVFVEIEGDEAAIVALAGRLGRGPADFILDSYRGIWVSARGADAGDMLF
ncbi:MAG TPA: class IV adenylate cyclase [Vicinamibacterales bacterium]|nr:class IV adenylate cyclase [Vicinamibacterales bacterium]